MPPKPPKDLCECFGWASDYMTTSGHHLNCEKRIAKPRPFSDSLRNSQHKYLTVWQGLGASRVEALETAHYVISSMKRDLETALSHARSNQ